MNKAIEAGDTVRAHWGAKEAAFYADHEDEAITIHLRGGETLRGWLVGVDQYNLTIELEADKGAVADKVLVMKHAIDYITPG